MLHIQNKTDKRILNTASATVLILAISAGILSYSALRELAIKAGIPHFLAFLFPITLDGLILAGSLLILYFAVRGKRSGYGLFLTALGVIASIAGNVVIAPNNLTYQILHATSPVVLFLALEGLMILLRARSKTAIELLEAEQSKELLEAEKTKEAVRLSESLSREKATDATLEIDRPTESIPDAIQVIPVTIAPVTSQVDHITEAPIDIVSSKNDIQSLEVKPDVAVKTETVNNPVTKVEEVSSKHSQNVTAPKTQAPKVSTPKASTIVNDDNPKSKRELIKELLLVNAHMEANDIIDAIGGERKYLQKLIRDERSKILTPVNA